MIEEGYLSTRSKLNADYWANGRVDSNTLSTVNFGLKLEPCLFDSHAGHPSILRGISERGLPNLVPGRRVSRPNIVDRS